MQAKQASGEIGGGPPAAGAPDGRKTKQGEKFDIYKCDYPWVDAQTDKREMRLAYECMKEDGGFPDLTDYCLKKLKALDPKFKTTGDFNNYTPDQAKEANDDVLGFLSDMKKADNKLRSQHEKNQSIFDNGFGKENQDLNDGYAGQYNEKKKAEDERIKGNEYMKSREYAEAVECYTKSLEIFEEAATYSNRAMANLRLKMFV